MADLSNIIRASGINPERTATELFGMAVEQFIGNPATAALNAANGGEPPINRNEPGTWAATSYAHSFANSQFRPKLKFMFRVEFLFKPEVLAQFSAQTAAWKNNFAFLIKSVDRPKVDFEYEDVNLYNFRTKILKQIKHRELTMTFADDVGNNVHEFFRFMMMVHSPITRRSVGASHEIAEAFTTYDAGSGMLFSDNLGNTQDFANRGVINTDIGNAIQAIKVTQIFTNPASSLVDGVKEVSFFFINPRIVSFDLDDVNHELSEANIFTMQFDYDFMVMSDARQFQQVPNSKGVPSLGSAPGEPSPIVGGTATQYGANNPYTSILAGIAGSAAKKITSETIGRALRTVPGLARTAETLGGIVQGIARDSVTSIGRSINQSVARPTRDVLVDSTTAGRDVATFQSSTGVIDSNQPTPAEE